MNDNQRILEEISNLRQTVYLLRREHPVQWGIIVFCSFVGTFLAEVVAYFLFKIGA